MIKFKVGEKLRIVKYSSATFDGIIRRMDPILSANGKRVIAYWYVIEYCQTIDYFCKRGELGLFTKSDIAKWENYDG